jgi:hypothetical protein
MKTLPIDEKRECIKKGAFSGARPGVAPEMAVALATPHRITHTR